MTNLILFRNQKVRKHSLDSTFCEEQVADTISHLPDVFRRPKMENSEKNATDKRCTHTSIFFDTFVLDWFTQDQSEWKAFPTDGNEIVVFFFHLRYSRPNSMVYLHLGELHGERMSSTMRFGDAYSFKNSIVATQEPEMHGDLIPPVQVFRNSHDVRVLKQLMMCSTSLVQDVSILLNPAFDGFSKIIDLVAQQILSCLDIHAGKMNADHPYQDFDFDDHREEQSFLVSVWKNVSTSFQLFRSKHVSAWLSTWNTISKWFKHIERSLICNERFFRASSELHSDLFLPHVTDFPKNFAQCEKMKMQICQGIQKRQSCLRLTEISTNTSIVDLTQIFADILMVPSKTLSDNCIFKYNGKTFDQQSEWEAIIKTDPSICIEIFCKIVGAAGKAPAARSRSSSFKLCTGNAEAGQDHLDDDDDDDTQHLEERAMDGDHGAAATSSRHCRPPASASS